MKGIKFIISFIITVTLVWAFNRSWDFGNPIPPLGKFLDPLHGFWANAEPPYADDQQIDIPGLKGKVSVIYDSLLIPPLFAENDDDL